MPRARNIPTDGPPTYEDELGAIEEIERKAAGDIALLDDPTFNSYKWSIWRLRLPEEISAEPQGGEWEHVATKFGPIDEDWARGTLGGGVFEFRGYFDVGDGRGRRMQRRPVIAIAGPRKNFAVLPPVVAAPPTPPPPVVNGSLTRAERIMLRMMRNMDQRLTEMQRTSSNVQPPPAPTLKDLADTLSTLDVMRRRDEQPAINPDKEIVGTLLGMVEKGIEIGQSREPIATVEREGTDWPRLIESALPMVDRILARVPARRPPPPGRTVGSPTQPPPGPGTEAPPPPPEAEMNHRWPTAIESLANAIAYGEDPKEFAITLEHILNRQEIGILRLSNIDQVMTELAPAFGTYPILNTPEARVFIDALLTEIKSPSPDSE